MLNPTIPAAPPTVTSTINQTTDVISTASASATKREMLLTGAPPLQEKQNFASEIPYCEKLDK